MNILVNYHRYKDERSAAFVPIYNLWQETQHERHASQTTTEQSQTPPSKKQLPNHSLALGTARLSSQEFGWVFFFSLSKTKHTTDKVY